MTDKISAERRSANMRAIRSGNTSPEMSVRHTAHALGYRYRLHKRGLPGKPDLVFVSRRCAIFVHGCFWHQHARVECLNARPPKSNTGYWGPKLARNIERDAANLADLKADGWRVLVIWECETKDAGTLASRLKRFLGRLGSN